MPASANEPPRLRAALNRPAASLACSVVTDWIAAWFRNTIAKIVPTPRISCENTKSPPADCAVRSVSCQALNASTDRPKPTARRMST